MVVQLPPEHEPTELQSEVEAGVIDDARARHRRERWAAAIFCAIAVAIGLVLGLSGGGGGSRAADHHLGGSGTPGAAGRDSSQPVAVTVRTPSVMQFGLLAPGVGWAANGVTFDLTRDGGRAWDVLSRDTDDHGRYSNTAVPGLGLSGDIGANITAAASPSPGVLALGFIDGRAASSCKPARTPAEGAGVVVLTADAGRTWSTHVLPGCSLTTSVSFISSRVGFAVLSGGTRSSGLFRTDDGGRDWQLLNRFPAPTTVSFGNRHDGLALVTPNDKSGAAALYRSTDGGRIWRRSSFCGRTADPTRTVYCGEPISFGRRGVVLAVVQDLARRPSVRAYVYATTDGGRDWTRRPVPPLASPMYPSFSAPNANDLFVSLNGVLHVSTDAGRSWSSIAQPGFRRLGQMQFISADYGWALAGGQFDFTADGGHSWKPIGAR
jgi:photosystem II stability/assembly factor-like uncharacterized protein